MSGSWRALVTNGLILAGAVSLFVMGAERDAEKLLPTAACGGTRDPIARCGDHADLQALETSAARQDDARTVTELAGAYLDRDQSGLASAVIEHAPSAVRARPEVAQTYARALFARGRIREALAIARDGESTCAASDDASPASCPGWLMAKSARQVAFLEEVVAAGIEDPYANPAATMAAYERSSRSIGVVAMR